MALSPVEARALIDRIAEPYPVKVFTPLSDEERQTALSALHALGFYASERLHAEWARHLALVAHARLREEGIPRQRRLAMRGEYRLITWLALAAFGFVALCVCVLVLVVVLVVTSGAP